MVKKKSTEGGTVVIEEEPTDGGEEAREPQSKMPVFRNPNYQHQTLIGGKKKTWRSLKQIVAHEKSLPWPQDTPFYSNINAPPALKPPKKYSDISGLEVTTMPPKIRGGKGYKQGLKPRYRSVPYPASSSSSSTSSDDDIDHMTARRGVPFTPHDYPIPSVINAVPTVGPSTGTLSQPSAPPAGDIDPTSARWQELNQAASTMYHTMDPSLRLAAYHHHTSAALLLQQWQRRTEAPRFAGLNVDALAERVAAQVLQRFPISTVRERPPTQDVGTNTEASWETAAAGVRWMCLICWHLCGPNSRTYIARPAGGSSS